MAKKKRRRPPAKPGPDATPGSPASTAPAPAGNPARRARKEEARRAREAQARRTARRGALRRVGAFALAGIIGIGAFWLINRAASPEPLSAEVKATATAAGCDPDVRTPTDDAPGNLHLEPGQDPGYTESPATSGYHAASTLFPETRVLTGPVDETQAVHTLEHGSVIVYYRPPGDGGVVEDVLSRLGPIVEQNPASYLIPYAGLPDGAGLAFTAWNKILTCPGTVGADQAATIAQGFIDSYACTSNAPEGKLGDGC